MAMRRILRRIKRLVLRQTWEQYSVDEWNRQYLSSTWQYLADLEQVPRYAVIDGWRRHLKPAGSILDLGCGEGTLFEHIASSRTPVSYTGVDVSRVAVDAATKKIRDPANERFVCADLVMFEPAIGMPFDVIVFNEVLYYVPDPVAVARRYLAMLAPEGIVIVSVFSENRRAWNAINSVLEHQCLQKIAVRDMRSGKQWYLAAYGPRS